MIYIINNINIKFRLKDNTIIYFLKHGNETFTNALC